MDIYEPQKRKWEAVEKYANQCLSNDLDELDFKLEDLERALIKAGTSVNKGEDKQLLKKCLKGLLNDPTKPKVQKDRARILLALVDLDTKIRTQKHKTSGGHSICKIQVPKQKQFKIRISKGAKSTALGHRGKEQAQSTGANETAITTPRQSNEAPGATESTTCTRRTNAPPTCETQAGSDDEANNGTPLGQKGTAGRSELVHDALVECTHACALDFGSGAGSAEGRQSGSCVDGSIDEGSIQGLTPGGQSTRSSLLGKRAQQEGPGREESATKRSCRNSRSTAAPDRSVAPELYTMPSAEGPSDPSPGLRWPRLIEYMVSLFQRSLGFPKTPAKPALHPRSLDPPPSHEPPPALEPSPAIESASTPAVPSPRRQSSFVLGPNLSQYSIPSGKERSKESMEAIDRQLDAIKCPEMSSFTPTGLAADWEKVDTEFEGEDDPAPRGLQWRAEVLGTTKREFDKVLFETYFKEECARAALVSGQDFGGQHAPNTGAQNLKGNGSKAAEGARSKDATSPGEDQQQGKPVREPRIQEPEERPVHESGQAANMNETGRPKRGEGCADRTAMEVDSAVGSDAQEGARGAYDAGVSESSTKQQAAVVRKNPARKARKAWK